MKGKSTKTEFPGSFFAELERGNEDGAIDTLRQAALPDGQVPSPRAQKLIASGEWDTNHLLSLNFIEADACCGKVGNDDYRFCGKARNYCKSLTKNQVGAIQKGWYISLGKQHGAFTTPFLPPVESGGPITPKIAARLLDGDNPFRMTKGKWKFVIDSWHAAKVGSPVSDFDDFEESSAAPPKPVNIPEPDKIAPAPIQLKTIDLSFLGQSAANTTPSIRTFSAKPAPTAPVDTTPASESVATDTGTVQPIVVTTAAISTSQGAQQEIEALKASLKRANEKLAEVSGWCTLFQKQLQEARQLQVTTTERCNQLENTTRYQRRIQEDAYAATAGTFRNIEQRVGALEATPRAGFGDGNHELVQDCFDKIEQLDKAINGSTGPMGNLRRQFLEFKEASESGGSMDCHGVSFKSKSAFLEWFNLHEPPTEIFLDALAYMHAIRAPVVHMDEASRQRESQEKISMSSTLEVAVITSFDTILPSILVGGKRQTESFGGTFSWLIGYLKKYEVWKPVGSTNGVSHQIISGIPRVTDRIDDLRAAKDMDSVALRLSTGLCTDSARFCNEFVRFITEQQEELTINSGYTETQVWQMQVESMQKIVEELSEARGSVADAARFQPGLYVWGMYKAWKIQKRYLENHFKDDPALTGIMVRRIVTQGHDSGVKKQLDKIEVIERKVEEHFRQHVAELKKVKDSIANLKK